MGTGQHILVGVEEKGGGSIGINGFRFGIGFSRIGVEWSERIEWSEQSGVEQKGECPYIDDRPELRKVETK